MASFMSIGNEEVDIDRSTPVKMSPKKNNSKFLDVPTNGRCVSARNQLITEISENPEPSDEKSKYFVRSNV